MPQIVCDIDLDVSVKDDGQKLMAKAGDRQNRLLRVRLVDCGKPLPIERSAVVLLNVAKGEQTGAYEGRVLEEGTALFVIPDLVLQEAGTATCDVSALSTAGGRLTSSSFQIVVEAAVCPDGDLGSVGMPGMAEEFVASQMIYTLQPQAQDGGFLLSPAINRKYSLDLSDTALYAPNGTWVPITLSLPTPANAARENWVMLYCHAPLTAAGVGVTLTFAQGYLMADGEPPAITMGDFDVLCTYSPAAGTWQVGVVQYGAAEETV